MDSGLDRDCGRDRRADLIFRTARASAAPADPKAGAAAPYHVDHKDIIKGPFNSPQEVTRNCLSCHPDATPQT
ncbi:MAG: hypothetical protein U0559_01215 [Anaerolineae bacterium]